MIEKDVLLVRRRLPTDGEIIFIRLFFEKMPENFTML